MARLKEMTVEISFDTSKFDQAFEKTMSQIIYKEKKIMAIKKGKVSPFKKGRSGAKRTSKGGKFINISPDEYVVLAPMVGLEEMISAEMHQYWNLTPPIYHPCIGSKCPGELVGNEARFKGFMPVIVKGDSEPSIYSFTISVYNQLELLEDSLDEGETLAGMAIKIMRTGSGLKTRYTVIGTGKRIEFDAEVPDFVSTLGPTTENDIWELLEGSGEYDRLDFVDETPPPAKRKRKAKKSAPPADEDDEDDDDWGGV